jgi:hypothetical protein
MSPISDLESYYTTENEHWNRCAFQIVCEVIKEQLFENQVLPLELYSSALEIISEHSEQPLHAVELINSKMDTNSLNGKQKYFVLKWLLKYLEVSEFDYKTEKIESLLKSYSKKLKSEIEPVKPLVKSIRETLKEQVQKELESLPETLKDLEPEKRLNIVCKLIPYVLPKVEAVHSEKDEPDNWR